MPFGIIAHLLDVAFKGIKIQQKTGGLDIALVHAGNGRDVKAQLKVGEIDRFDHGYTFCMECGRGPKQRIAADKRTANPLISGRLIWEHATRPVAAGP